MIKTLFLAAFLLLMQMATAQTCRDTIPASTPDSRFIVDGNEVIDTETGLIWQRCSLGQTGEDCSGGDASTYSWQQALQAAGAPWRLPNIKELRSIVEEKCYRPAINATVFPNAASMPYWSASPDAYSHNQYAAAFSVDFYNGEPFSFEKSNPSLNARLVRGGQ